jgi:site-specific DNA-methyltransferase (adenine-specific)
MITGMATVSVWEERTNWASLVPRGYCRAGVVGIGEPSAPVEIPRREILLGDATERLRGLPTASIDCVVTSPPYYQLRDYGTGGQLGLEPSVDLWVEDLGLVFAEVARVLKPAGSLWLNLGDSFSRNASYGAPPKGLLCSPERLLLALAEDGWIVRNKVIWSKPNPLPTSITDRLTLTYEVIYLLVRSPRYFFDLDAIREPHRSRGSRQAGAPIEKRPDWAGPLAGKQDGLRRARSADQPGHALGKNPGDVWTIATRGFRGPHFATFPPELIRKPILANCPEAICTRCGLPWKRQVTVRRIPIGPPAKKPFTRDRQVMRFGDRWHTVREVGDLVPCSCRAATVPGVVLDPFMGAGTVGLVAEQLHRDWIGVEINPEYRDLALRRIEAAR